MKVIFSMHMVKILLRFIKCWGSFYIIPSTSLNLQLLHSNIRQLELPKEKVVMKCHFDCIFYYVSDMNRAISFYTDILGLKLTSRDIVARFDIDGVL
jgi:hypothetical protein